MRRPGIFLADLLKGVAMLGIRDPRVLRDVLRMLSLDRLEVTAASTLEGAWAREAANPRVGDNRVATASEIAPTAEAPQPSMTTQRDARLREITAPTLDTRTPDWYVAVTAVDRPSATLPATTLAEPLFPREKTRALLTSALATWSEDGPLDVARLVEQIAEARAIRTLPFESTATLRRGLQLLIDTGPGMGPFLLDVDSIVAEIERVVADDQIRTFYFTGSPTRGCAASGADEMHAWAPPPLGTPVFLLSDLGIGGPASTEERAGVREWLDFSMLVKEAGCPLIALVPYGPRRWPRALARALRIIHWDRRTTAALVRRSRAAPRRIAHER